MWVIFCEIIIVLDNKGVTLKNKFLNCCPQFGQLMPRYVPSEKSLAFRLRGIMTVLGLTGKYFCGTLTEEHIKIDVIFEVGNVFEKIRPK